MNSLKKILIQHGEKIALAVVILLCGYSLLGILSRNSKELELPGKKHATVDQEAIKNQIERVRQHLGSNDRVKPMPAAEKTSRMLAQRVLSGKEGSLQAILEWYPYVQNPPVGVPQLITKPVTPVGLNIPEAYRTRFGNPEGVRVYSSVDSIMVVAKDSKYLNFPEPGSRKMLLWRKAIGSGKDDLNPAVRASMMNSPRNETVAGTEDTSSTDAATGAAPAAAAGGSRWGVVGAAEKQPAAAAEGSKSSAEDGNAEQYKERWQKADVRAFDDLKAVCTPSSVVATGWELVTPTMYVLKTEPTAEILKKLMEEGLSPDLVEMTAEEEAAWKTQQEAKKKGTAVVAAPKPAAPVARVDWTGIMAPKVDVKAAPVAAPAVAVAAAAETPRYYVFLDRNIQQNMVYRYGLVASVQPRMPEKEILEKKEYLGWDIYAEVCGITGVPPTGGSFALPARMVKEVFETKMTAQAKGVAGVHLDFLPCYQPVSATAAAPVATRAVDAEKPGEARETAKADNEPQVKRKELRGDKGTLTPLGKAFRDREPCYSDFVYTDLVLTPKEFDFDLRLVSKLDGANMQATIKVQKVEKDGTVKTATFMIPFVALPNSPTWNDFLAKDLKGNPFWPAKILSFQEVYGALKDLKPIAIGEKRGQDDFTSGWGVVDARPFIIKGKRSIKNARTGEWKQAPDMPPQPGMALILAEMNPPKGQPRRFLRIFRPATQVSNDTQKYEFEYDWEPELTKKIEERTKRMSGSTEAGAPATGK